MKNSQLLVFCDFDGTFVKEDSLDILFEKHISSHEIMPFELKWNKGQIGSKECLSSLFAKIHEMTESDVLAIADQLTLTDGAHEFLKYLSSVDARFYIISDGVDVIINRVLENNNLTQCIGSIYCNKLRFDKNHPNFKPHSQSQDLCDHRRKCALCKFAVVSRIINSCGTSNTIYIGDGKSDISGAQVCEKVFAKNSLLRDQTIKAIKKVPFDNFLTILDTIQKSE